MVDSVEFCECDCLDDVKALGCSVVEVAGDLCAVWAVEQLPGGVGEVGEGSAVLSFEESSVLTDLKPVHEDSVAREDDWVGVGTPGGRRRRGQLRLWDCIDKRR